jgi:hypothetical protein
MTGMAADLPKEGNYKGTYFSRGTFKTNSLGKDRTLVVFDETGLQVTDGFLDHTTWHCWGMGDFAKGMGEHQGYCISTDTDGDKVLFRIAGEKHAIDQKSWKSINDCIEGTGKYEGVSCSVTAKISANEFPSAPEGYVQYATFEGKYKLK